MIDLIHLSKTFQVSDGTVEALRDITLHIEDGDIYGIIGMSGAGKSTLVRCINMLERPTSGQVIVDGKEMNSMSNSELRDARRSITMIFQGFNLLMQRNCLQNICFPMELAGFKKAAARRRALELLDLVGLPDKAKSYPAQLSGGQQQRVAIARALAIHPKVLLCDEATSALDPNTTHSILELIQEINQKLGITVVVITHQMSVVEDICNHVAILDDGRVVEEGLVSDIFSNPQSPAAKNSFFPAVLMRHCSVSQTAAGFVWYSMAHRLQARLLSQKWRSILACLPILLLLQRVQSRRKLTAICFLIFQMKAGSLNVRLLIYGQFPM